jgi:glycosyltransferase involved in cell wall biosynthesis
VKILFCCEFFFPSVGGAQEVVKQIAARMVNFGHEVHVATSEIDNQAIDSYLGISIRRFKVSGNGVLGIKGDIDSYQNFVLNNSFDIIFIYAAQQWTFDALWPILGDIKAKKVFVPCGYSAIFNQDYKNYFDNLPFALLCFDKLVFHAKKYRDIDFSVKNNLMNYEWIPNGADNAEFSIPPVKNFREAYQISDDAKVFLTVGSFSGTKGHMEVLSAYSLCKYNEESVLVLNGNQMPGIQSNFIREQASRMYCEIKRYGFIKYFKKISYLTLVWLGQLKYKSKIDMNTLAKKINQGYFGQKKRVIICDLSRPELIACFFESNLFVFASNIEYSPLVLFEAAAAGLPFLTVPVGNSREIVEWLGAGCICPADEDIGGFTRVNPAILADAMEKMISNETLMQTLSISGRNSWEKSYNWDVIASQYEKLFLDILK